MDIFIGLCLLVALMCLYALPSIVANSLHTENAEWINVLNLILGWTGIVWLLLLGVALMSRREHTED